MKDLRMRESAEEIRRGEGRVEGREGGREPPPEEFRAAKVGAAATTDCWRNNTRHVVKARMDGWTDARVSFWFSLSRKPTLERRKTPQGLEIQYD